MQETMNNRWCLYPWFLEDDSAPIHPEDGDRWAQLVPYGKLFRVSGSEGEGFVKLAYSHQTFRVKRELIQKIPPPRYGFGEGVRVLKTGRVGEVEHIVWHFQKKEPYYHLKVNERLCRTRYFGEELESLVAGEVRC